MNKKQKIQLEKNWWTFPGFEIEHMSSGFDLPVNIAFVPNPKKGPKDPLLYVSELYGQIRVISNDWTVSTYAKDLLNYKGNHLFPGTGESGLIGVCANHKPGEVLATMIYEDKEDKNLPKSKVLLMKSKDGLKMDSIHTIIDNIPSVKAAHQIQAVTVGYDGKCYINVGDGMIDSSVAQKSNDLRGKILRINLDGSIPKDNPKLNSPVFAKGVRNPFGATWRHSDKSLYISDNGPEIDDRIAKIEAGKNYGWPKTMRQNSIFWWNFTEAPTALAFSQDGQFPQQYHDELFVALFGAAYAPGRSIKGKKIVKLQLDKNAKGIKSHDSFVVYIGDGPASPCGLAFGSGGLYFTDLHGENDGTLKKPVGNIYRVKQKV